jgi:hypothetical protein
VSTGGVKAPSNTGSQSLRLISTDANGAGISVGSVTLAPNSQMAASSLKLRFLRAAQQERLRLVPTIHSLSSTTILIHN